MTRTTFPSITEKIPLSAYAIVPDTGLDLTTRIQAIINANPGKVMLFDRPGTYRVDTKTTVGSLNFVLTVLDDDTQLHGVPGAILETDEAAYLIMAAGFGKPAGMASWASNEFVDVTFYTINPAAKSAITVTTATAANAGNFAADDWVLIRTGQLSGSGVDIPDGEINQIESADAGTGVITLRYPLSKPYAQEYFISGTSGLTSTDVTANLAILGIGNVTDRVLSGFALKGLDLRAPNATVGLLNFSQSVNYEFSDCRCSTQGNLMGAGGSRFTKLLRNKIEITGSGSYWHFAADKFSGDIEIAYNRTQATSTGLLHVNEGTYKVNVHDNEFYSGPAFAGTDPMAGIFARVYDFRGTNNILSGTGFNSGFRVDTYGFGGGILRDNTILGAPVSGEIVVLASGWTVEGNKPSNHTVNFVTGGTAGVFENLLDGGPPMRLECSSTYLADDWQTKTIAIFPPHIKVDSVQIYVQQAFNSDGTDQISVGVAADHVAYAALTDVSTTGIKTVTQGASVGVPQESAQTIVAYYVNGGSEPNTGRALVEVFWHRVAARVV